VKEESAASVAALIQASNDVVMITGDHVLTAVHVARRLAFVLRPPLILQIDEASAAAAAAAAAATTAAANANAATTASAAAGGCGVGGGVGGDDGSGETLQWRSPDGSSVFRYESGDNGT
jgi:magnesium-transporting ATPase (P-type)